MRRYILLVTILFSANIFPQTPQWEFMGLAGEEIYDIVIDDSGYVYIGSEGGVFKTTNNGTDWIFQNNGLIIQNVNKFFIDYDGNIYMAATGASNTGCGLYKSTDGGGYWAKIADTLNSKPVNDFYDVTIIPNEPGGIIYVSNYYGVYRSTDNGVTWQSTNFTNYLAIDIGINTNGYMFFGNATASWFGIYRSTDLGLNWERHTFLSVEQAMVYLRDGSVLVGCYDPGLGTFGIYKTTNNGDTWFNTNTFSGLSHPFDFVLDKNNDLYASVGYVFLSTNNGTSWLNYGLPGQGAYWLAIDPSGYIWSGNHLDGVYRAAGRTTPVELESFSAEINGNNVLLSWITATEINNLGFEIERSEKLEARGKNTNEDWEVIGFVGGKGTTTEIQFYSFIDKTITAGKYQYRLKQIDFDGSFEYSNIVEVEAGTLTDFYLSQNYPNPFNPETNIDYRIPEETLVNISLYDITGSKIKELVNEKKQPGHYTIKLKGGELNSGIYFYRLLTTSGHTAVKKLTIIK
ncbi:MAG TPA: T9SS type A sorting domain-containing protein [Ignavibacteriaceae bacterium]|nr:MAG: Two component regulator propeller [Ignavibacteria bacterium ADurb.Bin266]HQI42364.1 T9SS type A sorting domain-containing protein [Ignavibacteriaceae bacterium]